MLSIEVKSTHLHEKQFRRTPTLTWNFNSLICSEFSSKPSWSLALLIRLEETNLSFEDNKSIFPDTCSYVLMKVAFSGSNFGTLYEIIILHQPRSNKNVWAEKEEGCVEIKIFHAINQSDSESCCICQRVTTKVLWRFIILIWLYFRRNLLLS